MITNHRKNNKERLVRFIVFASMNSTKELETNRKYSAYFFQIFPNYNCLCSTLVLYSLVISCFLLSIKETLYLEILGVTSPLEIWMSPNFSDIRYKTQTTQMRYLQMRLTSFAVNFQSKVWGNAIKVIVLWTAISKYALIKTIVGKCNFRTVVQGQHKNSILPLNCQGYIVIFVQRVWGIYYICCL